MRDMYIGIDPGVNGFVAVYMRSDAPGMSGFSFHEMPKIGKLPDMNAINRLFKSVAVIMDQDGIKAHACLEDVHAKAQSAAKATFSFGYIVGAIELAVIANGIPFTKVAPKLWQKEMWAGIPVQKKPSSTGKTMVNDTKLMSKMAAKRLFPGMDLRRNARCANDDDNKIDALLMCEYCRRKF